MKLVTIAGKLFDAERFVAAEHSDPLKGEDGSFTLVRLAGLDAMSSVVRFACPIGEFSEQLKEQTRQRGPEKPPVPPMPPPPKERS
jgi:hypothetical protein